MSYDDPDPVKDFARKNVHNAIRRGELSKSKECVECGMAGLIHGHHDDYKHPLKVIWLCPQCHKDRHENINKLGIKKIIELDEVYAKAISVSKVLIQPLPFPAYF